MELMRAKIGLIETKDEDASLIQDLLALMHLHHVDYTIFFRSLGLFQTGSASLKEPLRDFFLDRDAFDNGLIGTRTGCAKKVVETMTAWYA